MQSVDKQSLAAAIERERELLAPIAGGGTDGKSTTGRRRRVRVVISVTVRVRKKRRATTTTHRHHHHS